MAFFYFWKMNSNEIIVSEGKKPFNVFNFEEFQPAFDFGLLYSNKLNIDLLDATEKGNSKWIDKTKL